MALGYQLARAELFSVDPNGKRITLPNRAAVGYTVMHLHETRSHALSHANTTTSDEQEERDREEAEAHRLFDELDPIDKELIKRANTHTGSREQKMPFKTSMRAGLEAGGWNFVKSLKGGQVLMVKTFQTTPTQQDLANEFGMRITEVRRRLNSVSAKVVRLAIEKGWL